VHVEVENGDPNPSRTTAMAAAIKSE